jgi:hypothetical protein
MEVFIFLFTSQGQVKYCISTVADPYVKRQRFIMVGNVFHFPTAERDRITKHRIYDFQEKSPLYPFNIPLRKLKKLRRGPFDETIGKV